MLVVHFLEQRVMRVIVSSLKNKSKILEYIPRFRIIRDFHYHAQLTI